MATTYLKALLNMG